MITADIPSLSQAQRPPERPVRKANTACVDVVSTSPNVVDELVQRVQEHVLPRLRDPGRDREACVLRSFVDEIHHSRRFQTLALYPLVRQLLDEFMADSMIERFSLPDVQALRNDIETSAVFRQRARGHAAPTSALDATDAERERELRVVNEMLGAFIANLPADTSSESNAAVNPGSASAGVQQPSRSPALAANGAAPRIGMRSSPDQGEAAVYDPARMPPIEISQCWATLLPPQDGDAFEALKASIAAEGCREPLVCWRRDGRWVLLDGHHRHRACTELGRTFQVTTLELPDDAAAERWIFANARARRNLCRAAQSYVRGRLYAAECQQGRRTDRTSGQVGQKLNAGAAVAKAEGVSARTVRRDAEFARLLDKAAEHTTADLRTVVLSGAVPATIPQLRAVLAMDTERGLKIWQEGVLAGRSAEDVVREFLRTATSGPGPTTRATRPITTTLMRHGETLEGEVRVGQALFRILISGETITMTQSEADKPMNASA